MKAVRITAVYIEFMKIEYEEGCEKKDVLIEGDEIIISENKNVYLYSRLNYESR
jgi:hypothetical protein